MQDMVNTLLARLRAYNESESGMEAAQVILILGLVVVCIFIAIPRITRALNEEAQEVGDRINNVNP